MRKEKLKKVGLCFITGCFIKHCNHFLFSKLIRSAVLAIRHQDVTRNIKTGNCERHIAMNGKLQYLFQK